MGTVDLPLAADLRRRLGLRRAVETGTFRGGTARRLATVFPEVVTIELSVDLHRSAQAALRDTPRVRALQGHSVARLGELTDPDLPTLYYLDGHWSGGATGGSDDECPVLAEIAAIAAGHPDDCVIVDDARMFTSAPPPPHRAEQWPTLMEVVDAIRERHPDHLVTLLADQIVAVPSRARPALDDYGARLRPRPGVLDHLRGVWGRGSAWVADRLRTIRAR
jgi:hypothetical protein